ncbi:glycosyltransferase family 4 protein [Pseudotenacibaculum haliotis]|uniref:Glycosyltransferase family 4 protein n=1 Tax=Pseudotenacibaculum haliotis TaxID=1862138 RepID=A0ABW5LS77_9FLAO
MAEFLEPNLLRYTLIAAIGSFLLTFYLIPKIIKVVNHKELMDHPNARSSHKQLTPTFGGISFYVVLMLILLFLGKYVDDKNLGLNIAGGITILLFTGLKDDLVVISNVSKLIGQISAISVFLFLTDYTSINFYGAFGIQELSGVLGFGFMLVLMLAIINSFNLIDGIDGLAASVGVITLSLFGTIFYHLEQIFFCVICFGLVGALIAFLRFNFSEKKKIFMGDTGSLILGFVVAVMSVQFLTLTQGDFNEIFVVPKNAIFALIAIIIFPFFDMMRVFLLRLVHKKNPFVADKNHTHHILLSLGNSHTKSSLLIVAVSIVITILLFYTSKEVNNSWLLLGIYAVGFLSFYIAFIKFASEKK